MRKCRKHREKDPINFTPKPNQSAIILSSLPDGGYLIDTFIEEADEKDLLSSGACMALLMREVLELEESDPIFQGLLDKSCKRAEEAEDEA